MIQEVKLENITKQIGTTTILENICLTWKLWMVKSFIEMCLI